MDPATDAALTVCADDAGHGTRIGYDASQRQMYVDRTKSRAGEPFHKDFPAHFTAPIARDAKRGPIPLRIFVDHSSVEVFADDGLAVVTANTFPAPSATRLIPPAAPSAERSLQVWKLSSIWNTK